MMHFVRIVRTDCDHQISLLLVDRTYINTPDLYLNQLAVLCSTVQYTRILTGAPSDRTLG